MTSPPLPDGAFGRALGMHVDVQVRRAFALYNRTRALFAESVVAALLPGSEVVEDPGAAWDVVWRSGRRTIRLQVKCSGEHLPRLPGRRTMPSWDLKPPRSGWDPDSRLTLEAGHHCHVAVLARHTGLDIAAGWTFWVVPAEKLPGLAKVTPSKLAPLGSVEIAAHELPTAVRRAAR